MVLPCLMTALNSIGGSCFGWAGDRIQTEVGHLFSYADNIETLRTKVHDLNDAMKAVENRIEEAANRGETLVVPVVDRLLKRMASIEEEASKLIVDEERSSDSRCLMGLRPNLWACYLISKSSKKAIDEAAELLEKGKALDRVVANVDYSKFLGVTPIEEFEELESRAQVTSQIVAALNDPSVNKVGIYGMGGTGKTTLAEKIGAKLQLDSTFNFVVLATVSEKQNQRDNNYQPDLLNIQKQIADGFKIELQGKTLKNRAVELCMQLQKKDKVLIILDDIWSGFELKDVGIPISNVDKTFKILMTSRSEDVLLKEMNSKCMFALDSLPHPDAWILFDRMIGGDSEYSKWRATAEQVVKQCGGIPIILVTIAKSLRNEVSESWEDALTQLKKFDGENILEAYKMIEVSYKFLKSEEKKKLLILCAQLNHRAIYKEDLVKYAMGLNLFHGCIKFKEVYNRLHRYLSDLKGCCLLQDGNNEGVIKMHDVVHKFVSFVASRDHSVFSVAHDCELEDWPSKDELEHFSAISLPRCHLPPDEMLPVAFDNPKLESFLLFRREIDASFKIPDNFFIGLKGLKLMDLTCMSLSSVLVSSFEVLVKLRTLCLDGCELSDISVIGELPILQILSLVGSSIALVPKEIGKLGSTLKQLDMRRCFGLERIAAGVISRLTLLEVLRFPDTFITWQRLGGRDKSIDIDDVSYEAEIASLEEFKNLRSLIHLEIHIHDHAKMFPKDLVFKKLETFTIISARYKWWGRSCNRISTRTLGMTEAIEFDGEGSKTLMTKAEMLFLKEVLGSVTVGEMDPKGFPELKYLNVYFCDGIQYIIKKGYSNCIFPKLDTLGLSRLVKLERICDDHDHPLPVGSFENLSVIDVHDCDLLNHLLSSNLARGLLRLQEIQVTYCRSMKNIIVSRETENEEEIQIGFTHQLQVLKLAKLPCLVSFCNFKQIEGVSSPTPFFNKKIMFSKLEVLELSNMENEKIWDVDHLAIPAEGTTCCWLQNLTSLKVSDCHKLRYLFTSSMVKSLARLKQLQVSNCESIEEIVTSTERETAGDILLSFPKLDSLELEALPKLKRFCEANLLECQLLLKLTIGGCSELKTFICANDSSSSDNSTTLFTEKVAFSNLKELKITDFPSLPSIFSASLVPTFQQLKRLEVQNCDKIDLIGFNNTQQVNDAFTKRISSLEYCNIDIGGLKLKYKDQRVTLELAGHGFQVPRILFAFLKSFSEFDELAVSGYSSITQLFPCELDPLAAATGDDMDTQTKTLAHIGILKLTKLSNMKQIWSEHSPLKYHVIPKTLLVNDCDNLLSLVPPSTTLFTNLTALVVWDCPNLIKLVLSSSTAKSLMNLEEMSVGACDSLEEIVVIEELANIEEYIVFEKLKALALLGMNSLISFCSTSDCKFRFPSLSRVVVANCPKMKFFTNGDLSTPKLIRVFPTWVEFEDFEESTQNEGRWEGDLNSTIRHLFEEKKLEVLELRYMEIEKIWDVDHLAITVEGTARWLQNLTCLKVSDCHKLIYLFTYSMVKSLARIKELQVSNCKSIEEIVTSMERETTGDIQLSFPKLDSLELKALPKLKRFCEANLFECQLLGKLAIGGCSKLKTFISANDSSSSDNSKTLFTENVAFPNLKELKITDFPALASIFPTSLVPTFQQLKHLEVRNCGKIDLIGFNNTQQLNDAFAKGISTLAYCNLDIGGLKLKYENQRVTLEIDGRGFEVPRILFSFLTIFPELDEVAVSRYPIITQLFPCALDPLAGDDMDTQVKTLARIGHLKLTKLSNMKRIWSEHSSLKYHVIPKTLQVFGCDSLLSLAPPSPTLFKNLTGLLVWDCRKLIKLVLSSSSAKSLVNLEWMNVASSDSLEEIVVIEDQCEELANTEEYIVFEKLKKIVLQDMKSLISFCSASDCNFRFPSLNRVVLNNCPKMKFFCKGALSTPKLLRVWPSWVGVEDEEEKQNEGRWEGDLNSTIQQLFEEKVTTMGEDDLNSTVQ